MKNNSTSSNSSVYLLKALIDFASYRKVDINSLLKEINIKPDVLNNKNSFIPISVINDLWNRLSIELNDQFFGLHFGETFAIKAEGHFLFTLMKNCETLETAIKSLFRYHNLLTDIIKPYISVIDGNAIIEWDNTFPEQSITRHFSESVLSLLAATLCRITNNEMQIKAVCFTHDPPQNYNEYERIFTLRPLFKKNKNQLIFDEKELNREFPLANREFESYLKHYAETVEQRFITSSKYTDRVAFNLKKSILNGEECSLESVAESFDMSIRHLQYKLKDEGFNYQTLLDRVRKEIAVHLLEQDNVFICDIAFTLGFSEQSSFNHAFKKWTCITPGEYRRKKRQYL